MRPRATGGLSARAFRPGRGGITPYQPRHTFAQHASDGGDVPVELLARLMGHTDTKTTGFYFKAHDRRAIQAAKTVNLKLSATKAGQDA